MKARFTKISASVLVCLATLDLGPWTLDLGPSVAARTNAQAEAAAVSELTLGGLRPGRDRLARAVALYGKHYAPAYESATDLLVWADPKKRLYLRLELREDKTIDAVTVASFGPENLPPSSLPLTVAATGRGLRLGDPLEKAIRTYGKPYFQGPSSEGERELLFVVHKFSADKEQPQILETSYDPKTLRLLKITLSFPYY